VLPFFKKLIELLLSIESFNIQEMKVTSTSLSFLRTALFEGSLALPFSLAKLNNADGSYNIKLVVFPSYNVDRRQDPKPKAKYFRKNLSSGERMGRGKEWQ